MDEQSAIRKLKEGLRDSIMSSGLFGELEGLSIRHFSITENYPDGSISFRFFMRKKKEG